MVRDKLTKQGIADAVIKVEDHDHDIRSGQPLEFIYLLAPLSAEEINKRQQLFDLPDIQTVGASHPSQTFVCC